MPPSTCGSVDFCVSLDGSLPAFSVELKTGNFVWVTDKKSEGTIVRETDPRSYRVQTSHGSYRRNRRHLVLIPQSQNTSLEDNAANENSNTGSRSLAL